MTTAPSTRVLLLRTCDSNGRSHGGFQWPLEVGAEVVAPDWDPKPECGKGLHGLPWGEGDGRLLDWSPGAKWIVWEADTTVDLRGKHKAERGVVRFVGDRKGATDYLVANGAIGERIVGSTLTGGNGSTLTGGYGSTLMFLYWDDTRLRAVIAYPGEGGIEANREYRLDDAMRVVLAPAKAVPS